MIGKSREEIVRLAALLGKDSVLFNTLLLPDMFDAAVPNCHREVYAALSNPSKRIVIVQMPRGFGKTTILQGYLIQQVVNLLHKVILYISDTYSQAELHTEAVRDQLEGNDRILDLYGEQVGKRWTGAHWITRNGVSVLPKGVDQSIRGVKVGRERPTLAIIDDPENDINSLTPEQNDKLWRQLFAVIRPMLGRRGDNKIIWLGTPVNERCVLLRLMELFRDKEEAAIIEMAARDVNHISLWPELWSKERLDEEERIYAKAGLAHVFAREYLGKIISPEGALFDTRKAAFYDTRKLPGDLWNYMSIDCAFSKAQSADFCAMVVFSASLSTQKIYVRETIRGKLMPNEFFELILEHYKRYEPFNIFVQKSAIDSFFKFYANEKYELPFKDIPISRAKDSKIMRISSMQPLFKSRRLQFTDAHADLLHELALCPRAAHDDLSDALATGILNIGMPGFDVGHKHPDKKAYGFGTFGWVREQQDRHRKYLINRSLYGVSNDR